MKGRKEEISKNTYDNKNTTHGILTLQTGIDKTIKTQTWCRFKQDPTSVLLHSLL